MRKQIDAKATVVETENLFEVLGLPQTATKDEVKNAYFDAAKRFHPDRLDVAGPGGAAPRGGEDLPPRVARPTARCTTTRAARSTRRRWPSRASDDAEAHAKAMKMLEAEMAFRRGEILLRKNDFVGAIRELEAGGERQPARGRAPGVADLGARLRRADHLRRRQGALPRGDQAVAALRARLLLPRRLRCKEEKDIDRAYNVFKKAHELDARLLDAEREMRLINMRKEKEKRSGGCSIASERSSASSAPSAFVAASVVGGSPPSPPRRPRPDLGVPLLDHVDDLARLLLRRDVEARLLAVDAARLLEADDRDLGRHPTPRSFDRAPGRGTSPSPRRPWSGSPS